MSISADRYYRLLYTVSVRSAGDVRPRLNGGTILAGVTVAADGQKSDRIPAATGNDRLEFLASTDFVGQIDDVVLFLDTASLVATAEIPVRRSNSR